MSNIPAAKAALIDIMKAWVWPGATPMVAWAGPYAAEDMPPGGEVIFFGDTIVVEDVSVTMGDIRRDETFTLSIIIDVRAYGDVEQATEQRAWELYASFVSMLDQNRTFGGAINRQGDRTVRQTNRPAPEQWITRIVVEQDCYAYYTP